MMKEFWDVYPELREDLSSLLGMSFVPDSPDCYNAIGLTFDSIFQSHIFGDVSKRDLHLNRLDMIRKNLREIKDFDEKVFKQFKRMIKRSNKVDDFFGIRFELNISATLIREKVSFQKSESPDFLVHNELGSAAIECTSARIRTGKVTGDLRYKIESAIRNKSQKSYANKNTALFIDITNLVYNTVSSGENYYKLLDRKNLAPLLAGSNFGNLSLFVHISETSKQGNQSVYTRIDDSLIDKRLCSILDLCFEKGYY